MQTDKMQYDTGFEEYVCFCLSDCSFKANFFIASKFTIYLMQFAWRETLAILVSS